MLSLNLLFGAAEQAFFQEAGIASSAELRLQFTTSADWCAFCEDQAGKETARSAGLTVAKAWALKRAVGLWIDEAGRA